MDRTPRTAATREEESRRTPWAPPSVLAAPPAPAGYQNRWVRASIRGEEDKGNVFSRLRQGYEPVRADQHPEFQAPTIDDGKHAGVIGNGGLILTRIPVETAHERTEF